MNSESKTNLDDLLHKFEDIYSGELGAMSQLMFQNGPPP